MKKAILMTMGTCVFGVLVIWTLQLTTEGSEWSRYVILVLVLGSLPVGLDLLLDRAHRTTLKEIYLGKVEQLARELDSEGGPQAIALQNCREVIERDYPSFEMSEYLVQILDARQSIQSATQTIRNIISKPVFPCFFKEKALRRRAQLVHSAVEQLPKYISPTKLVESLNNLHRRFEDLSTQIVQMLLVLRGKLDSPTPSPLTSILEEIENHLEDLTRKMREVRNLEEVRAVVRETRTVTKKTRTLLKCVSILKDDEFETIELYNNGKIELLIAYLLCSKEQSENAKPEVS
jgi:hypothetical protein